MSNTLRGRLRHLEAVQGPEVSDADVAAVFAYLGMDRPAPDEQAERREAELRAEGFDEEAITDELAREWGMSPSHLRFWMERLRVWAELASQGRLKTAGR